MKIALIDFEDSFTHNIVHSLELNPLIYVEVFNYKNLDLKILMTFDKLILSPGAETPKEKEDLYIILEQLIFLKPILGICLGFQIIAYFFKQELYKLKNPKHGIQSKVKINCNDFIFNDLPNDFLVGRYHSWAIKLRKKTDFINLAQTLDDQTLMIIKHKKLPIYGFQFHPESILTPFGNQLIQNWIKLN